jgi:transglutaminase-like putative cysteine protease
MVMNTYRSFCILVLAALLAACGGSAATPTPTLTSTATVEATPTMVPTATVTPYPAGISYLNPQKYQVEYRAVVHDSGFNVSRLLIYQPKPVEWDAQKEMTIAEVSPAPTHENIDAATGSGIYNWDISGKPKAGESLPIVIKFTFTAYETHTNISPSDVKPYNTSDPLYKQYTAPERFIESDDPQIKAKAAELAGAETNPLLLTRKFYDYIIDHSTYNLTGTGLKGAKALLTTGKGECGDYSSLFIAFSRASGIPARSVVGYWAVSGLDQTHVWAEFYLEGYGWVPADATIGQSQPSNRDFYFGNMDNQRVILNKGFNIALVPATSDNYIAPFLQVPMWWYWGSGNSNTISLDRVSWNVTKIQ